MFHYIGVNACEKSKHFDFQKLGNMQIGVLIDLLRIIMESPIYGAFERCW